MIDAHIHVFPDYTPEQHFALSRPEGVTQTVLIQAGGNRFDNSYMLAAVRTHPGAFSAVVIVDADSPELEKTILNLRGQGARGFRIGAQPKQPWVDWPGMNKLWEIAAKRHMTVCPLINPEAFPWVAAMCEKHRDTVVAIDHLGRVGAGGVIADADVRALCGLARHRHVHVKVSAFYALGKKRAPHDDLAPMIRQVYDSYGPRRMMWGSDSPYQTRPPHSYKASTDFIKSLPFLSRADLDWVTRRAAQRLFFIA